MDITIFKDIRTTSSAYYVDVYHALDRIKSERSKAKILIVRAEKDKTKRNILKRELPSICFSGTFKKRAAKDLIKHSGLMCLDFDGFKTTEDLSKFRLTIQENDFTFACFTSPSGNGLKVLIKVIPDVSKHKQFFDTLKDYFNSVHFDISTSDVSRVCYESCDPDLYLNKESKLWSRTPDIVKEIGHSSVNIKLKSEHEIIEKIFTWFNKSYSMIKGQRNRNVYILSSKFNAFGINSTTCESTLTSRFTESDFPTDEIIRAVKSAYSRNANEFNTQFFEDNRKSEAISSAVKSGLSKAEIKDTTGATNDEVKTVRKQLTTEIFWDFTDKGAVKMSHRDFRLFLEEEGYTKYYASEDSSSVLIKIKEQNIVQTIGTGVVKDYILNYIENDISNFGDNVYNFFAENTKYFKDDFLSFLSTKDITFNADTVDTGYIYFKNCAIKVTPAEMKIIDYIDLDGFIWEDQIIDRIYKKTNGSDSVYKKFIWLAANKEEIRFNSLKAVIGYMLHSFKNSGNNKAIILNDETISENPNGGSGKGIFANALSQMKNLSKIDGKLFHFEKSFPYQTVTPDTQILLFDDVKRNFSFESLFSLITEGITLEKKGLDAINIPVENSPKILISTNYTIGGTGGSFERRKHELEFSSYFNDNHSPADEFGHMFFDEWDSVEWSKFDSFMIECLQYYLKNGLIKSDFKNLQTRKFIKETSSEFWEWIEDGNIGFGNRYNKGTIYNSFIDDYPDFKKWLSRKKFIQWVGLFARRENKNMISGNSNGNRWIEVCGTNQKRDEVNDIWEGIEKFNGK